MVNGKRLPVEDPVGGEVHIGSEAIRGFYAMIPKCDNATDLFTLRTLGQEFRAHFGFKYALLWPLLFRIETA